MKIHLILIGLVIFSIGCQRSTIDRSYTINFEIKDTTRSEILIAYPQRLGLIETEHYVAIDSNRLATFDIDSIGKAFKAFINIDEVSFPIWVKPNSDLNIIFSKDTIMFTGNSKVFADYYQK